MKDLMERFVVLPFSVSCVSQSSLAVVEKSNKGWIPEINSSSTSIEEEEGVKGASSMKSSFRFLALPKSNNISTRFQKLFKSVSQLFVYKEVIEDEEEEDREMDIGYPTDVKHVTHIGYDGSTTTNSIEGWDYLIPAEFLSSIPSVSFRQFERSMAAQASSPPFVA